MKIEYFHDETSWWHTSMMFVRFKWAYDAQGGIEVKFSLN